MRRGRIKTARPDVWIGVVAALGVITYVAVSAYMNGVGLPLDDGWIHQAYARNLAERGEWAFVPGEVSVASTSPLFTAVLAVGYFIHAPHFVWTFALGILALAGAGWIGSRLGSIMFPRVRQVGIWTGLAIVTAWHMVWAASSGMETMLFSTLSLAVVGLAWRELPTHRPANDQPGLAFRRGLVLGLVGAALYLTRPEGLGLLALAGLLVLMAWPYNERDGWRYYLAWASGVTAAWLVGVVPYMAWNYHISGNLLPETASAKQAEYAYLREQWSLPEGYGQMFLPLLAGGLIILMPGVVAGVYGLVRRVKQERAGLLFLLPLGWAALDLSAYAIRLPANYQHGRYVMPILPHLLLYGVGGTMLLVKSRRRHLVQRVVLGSLPLSAILVSAIFWGIGARQYGQDVRIINTEMVATAKWVRANVPAEDLLAVHDIGALGYFAPRPIFDLAGLVSPEVVPVIRDRPALMQMMCERGVRYLMVFPDQRPTEATDPRLGTEWEYDRELGHEVVKPIFQTHAPFSIALGAGNMMVYEMNWTPPCGDRP
jgi:hypothetical protein